MAKEKVLIYKRFERFWHWAQALLISLLALTGFEIKGSYSLLGFESAVSLHNFSAVALMILIVFSIFWHLTTDEWRQYIPTYKNLSAQLKYYTSGIFKGEEHPVKKTVRRKMNPLQVLSYLGLKLVLVPLLVFSGIFYMSYRFTSGGQLMSFTPFTLEDIAFWHVLGAYLLVQFTLIHMYMTTTGHTVTENLRAMLTGYEDLEVEEQEPREELDKNLQTN
ncbi:cytochrome b561 (plasmid) [Fulvitalea axinellae]|uniref:Cytochrome b561 n=1 Tax=Fulvitalea axinellae TaxID=1182444 RepID=A0AAU9DAM6_9BACT|nr:cytochrome b561 [Fulvitalea axinellae]